MNLRVAARPAEVRAACDRARAQGSPVGFVPTMGALHEGHVALVSEACRRAAFVVASVFVNPTQFGPGEDFTRYPRDREGDLSKLDAAGVDLAFFPEPDDMYPPGDDTRVKVGAVAAPLEGERRPGHFEGVATVVTKLFATVGPCVAVFGRKDYQQLLVVRRLARDLLLPVEIVGHPIVRESDGLARSSRNVYLSAEERSRALAIVRGLDTACRRFAAGLRETPEIERIARQPLGAASIAVDYVALRDADTLGPPGDVVKDRAALLVACRVGKTRLIDNVILGEDPAPLG
jgi:pantoate--beta-alanine ligase